MRSPLFLSVAIVLSVSSCSTARKADEVIPFSVPEELYDFVSCGDMIAEAEEIRNTVPSLKKLVNDIYKEQKNIEISALLIAWPIAFALDRKHRQEERLAIAMGRINTISKVYIKRGC